MPNEELLKRFQLVYEGSRRDFQHYRNLTEVGTSLRLIIDVCSDELAEKLTTLYEAEDVKSLKSYIKTQDVYFLDRGLASLRKENTN